MYRLCSKIIIESEKTWTFDWVNSCKISQCIDKLTSSCRIKLPQKVTWEDESQIPIKRGDEISVYLGYDDELSLYFKGYVTSVSTTLPIEISAEDAMWILKQKAIELDRSKEKEIKTIPALLDWILPADFPYEIKSEKNLGKYRIKSETVAKALNSIKQYGIYCFLKLEEDGSHVLHCGTGNLTKESGSKPYFKQGVNIITDSTQYRSADSTKVKINAQVTTGKNEITTEIFGDKDDETAETVTIKFQGIDMSELKKWAEQKLNSLKYDGLSGSITTFGVPHVKVDAAVYVETDNIACKLYHVNQVETSFDNNGFRQILHLDREIV